MLPKISPTAPPRRPTPKPIPAPSNMRLRSYSVTKSYALAATARPLARSSTPCHSTNNPAAERRMVSETRPPRNPPMKAPTKAGPPMISTNRKLTRLSQMCLIAPKIWFGLLTSMLVPPAVDAAIPMSSMEGRRMVPKARPTKPPNSQRDYGEDHCIPDQNVGPPT